MESNSTISVSRHEKNLRRLPCAVSRQPQVTLHHVHGGSIKDHGWHVGVAQKQNPFLQIPLHAEYHVGRFGIDYGYGVLSWERDFGTQWEHLEWVNDQLPYDIFQLAHEWEEKNRSRSIVTRRSTTTDTDSTACENARGTRNSV